MEENEIAAVIVDLAIKIHKALGPGLFENVYEAILEYELTKKGFRVRRQHPVPIVYDGIEFDAGFRADLIVNDLVLIELKSIEALADVHKKQTLTYLRLTGLRLGLLMNFNESLMKNGIKRIANGMPD